MKIVVLLFVLVAAFCFAMKKTFDSQLLLAERIKTARTLAISRQPSETPPTSGYVARGALPLHTASDTCRRPARAFYPAIPV